MKLICFINTKVCSDDTIQTGYKPNVHINAASISQQIKAANLRLLNSSN